MNITGSIRNYLNCRIQIGLNQDLIRKLQADLARANELSRQGHYERANALCLEVIDQVVDKEEFNHNPSPLNQAPAEDEHNLIALALFIIGGCERHQHRYLSSIEYYRQSYEICLLTKNLSGQAKALGNIGTVKGYLNEDEEEVKYCLQAIQLDTEADNQLGVAIWQANLGTAYAKKGDYAKAMEHLSIALEIDEQKGNEAGLASRHANIGTVHQHMGHWDLAIFHLQKSLELDKKLGFKRPMGSGLNNLGMVYAALGKIPEAIEHYNQALQIHREMGHQRGIAVAKANLAESYTQMGDYNRALELQQEALEIDRALDNKSGQAVRLACIGSILLKQASSPEKLQQAEQFILQGLELSTALGNKLHMASCHSDLADLYEALSQPLKQIFHLKQCRALELEIHGMESRNKILTAEKQQNMRRQELEFQLARTAAVTSLDVTNKLLHRVLPNSIANRIINGEEEIADYFPAVSILFADIEGFTPLSADMPAHLVVRFLNHIFSHFDKIMKKHGCEKIKTIGDGYMAVAGVPTACDDHAERICFAALDMMKPIELPSYFKEYIPDNNSFKIRIGLHMGSVVAGLVGEDRFVYDVYSDAVNTAARMESHGEAGKIHVSADYMRHLVNRFLQIKKEDHGISFEKRGEIEIKGKGMMKTYFLSSRSV